MRLWAVYVPAVGGEEGGVGEGSRFDGVVGRPAVRGTWGGRGPGAAVGAR